MKRSDLKKCVMCDKGVMHNGNIQFYKVAITSLIVDQAAIQRQAGLEMFIGNPAIAAVMGPDENLANEVYSDSGIVCADCIISPLASILESIADKMEA